MNKLLCNIEQVKLNYQDRKIMVLEVWTDIEDGGVLNSFGMVLDTYNETIKQRQGSAYGLEMIRQLLDFFGVNDLSEVKNYKCYLLTDADWVSSASDVIGLENFSFEHYKHRQTQVIKKDVLNMFK